MPVICRHCGRESRRPTELTANHRKIVKLLCEGHKPAQIATIMGMSERAVKSALNLVYAKLGIDRELSQAGALVSSLLLPLDSPLQPMGKRDA